MSLFAIEKQHHCQESRGRRDWGAPRGGGGQGDSLWHSGDLPWVTLCTPGDRGIMVQVADSLSVGGAPSWERGSLCWAGAPVASREL